MAYLEGDGGWTFDITEWWDLEGEYHSGQPDQDEMLQASQMTGHYVDADFDDDMYVTFISEDGWTDDELYAEFNDWYQEGTGE